jgi:hypothetical protein
VSHDTTDNTVEAPAVEVVLFEDRARVRREAAVTLVPGAQTIRLSGAGLAVDDSSLAVSIEGARGEIELSRGRSASRTPRMKRGAAATPATPPSAPSRPPGSPSTATACSASCWSRPRIR